MRWLQQLLLSPPTVRGVDCACRARISVRVPSKPRADWLAPL